MRKKTKNKILMGILSLSVFSSLMFNKNLVSAETPPSILGEHAVTLEANSGEVLYDKNMNEKGYPASVTKVLTATIAAEHMKKGEEITLSQRCVNEVRSNSQILFTVGEKLDRDSALNAMMVISANDLACAFAEHISGSVEKFSDLMNKTAQEIGAKNSHFVTPNGLHDPNHYTTAYDMALIGREAIKHPEVLHAMSLKTVTVTTSKQTKTLVNPSKIHDDPVAIAGKTGFTNQARNTLMKIDEVDGKRVVNVILGNNNKVNKYNIYNDIKKISNYSIAQLENKKILDKNNWSKTVVIEGKQLLALPKEDVVVTGKTGEKHSYQIMYKKIDFNKEKLYTEGISKGEKIGEIVVKDDGKVVKTVDAVANKSLTFEKEKPIVVPFWVKILFAVGIPLLGYAGFVIFYNYKFFTFKEKTSE